MLLRETREDLSMVKFPVVATLYKNAMWNDVIYLYIKSGFSQYFFTVFPQYLTRQS